MNRLTKDACIARADNLIFTDLDDETILMSIDQGAYYGMEQTARRIWELLESPRIISDLCSRLSEEYRVEPALCEPEIISFLEELREEGLIVEV